MNDHTVCDRIRMLLAEVGLDPGRMHCTDDNDIACGVAAGVGSEGFTFEEVDRLTDKAIGLAATGERRVVGNEQDTEARS